MFAYYYETVGMLEHTPPFVLWTLAHACPLREASEFSNPEATERLLRGVRCYSAAIAEKRVKNGVVISPALENREPLGFQVEPVLEPLGGLDFIAKCCTQCPANAIAQIEPNALAGCVGYLVPPIHTHDFQRIMDELISESSNTVPRWYGLWLAPQLTQTMLELQSQVWRAYRANANAPLVSGLEDYFAAVELARRNKLDLRVQLYPPGTCEGRRWIVAAHCGRCMSPWPEARWQQCRVCGQVGGRQAERTRRRMGTRPFRPLHEFLSAEEIAALL